MHKTDGKWWLEKPMRMVQTNLREIDVALDIDQYVRSLKDFSANVVLFNVGGIIANYPTELEYHFRNPHLVDDVVGKAVERLHREGIRFVARFDFSKINKQLAERRPEWLYKSAQGEHISYNGQVHTCLNSGYQQEYALKILGEVIERYAIDAVFFNMTGYVTYDYSGNYHGICQCDNCRQRFGERYGQALPQKEDGSDPVFRAYAAFRRETVEEQFEKIRRFVKGKSENIALCNYTHESVDILRRESNTGIDRPLPEWNYSASENVKIGLGSWDHVMVSNAAVHFVDFAIRHSAVSPHLTAARLAQNLIHGGWLDYYVIGTLDNQDDRLCFEMVKMLFKFHEDNEAYFTDLEPLADVALVMPSKSSMYGSVKEFRGLLRMLAQMHVLFDVVHDSVLDEPDALSRLQRYAVVVLPEMRSMSEATVQLFDRYVEAGGKILATGASATCDGQGNPLERVQLACAGIDALECREKQQGTYFRIRPEDKEALKGFEDLDIIYLDGVSWDCRVKPGSKGYLGFIPPAMFGPPEKCYYAEETDRPGLVVNDYGVGRCAFIPWGIGKHYEKLSNHGHIMLFNTTLRDLLKYDSRLEVEVSQLVEVTAHKQKEGKWQLVGLVNLSGQLGTAFLPPLPISGVKVRLKNSEAPQGVWSLRHDRALNYRYSEGGVLEFEVPEFDLLESVVIRF